MPSARTLGRIDKVIWIAIYLGLFAIVLGAVTWAQQPGVGGTLVVLGGVAVAAGVVLIWVRSRLPVTTDPQ